MGALSMVHGFTNANAALLFGRNGVYELLLGFFWKIGSPLSCFAARLVMSTITTTKNYLYCHVNFNHQSASGAPHFFLCVRWRASGKRETGRTEPSERCEAIPFREIVFFPINIAISDIFCVM